jgi:hypothetical protein
VSWFFARTPPGASSWLTHQAIAAQTALSLRTILEQGTEKERTRTNELRRETIDKMAAADFKVKKRGREYLAKRINSTLKEGAELAKVAKGFGKERR